MEVYVITRNFNQQLSKVVEGNTKLWIIKTSKQNGSNQVGPSSIDTPVFFNPAMEFSRDLSILVLENFLRHAKQLKSKRLRILDGLAGTGARGVRFGNEVKNLEENEKSVVINDNNPVAYEIIQKNIRSNNLKNVTPSNLDLNSLLVKNRFDYIDIDPFGSPIKFLDSGTRMLRNGGILAVTATDTATLFGTYPKTCVRRYDSYSCRTPFSHELGTRILIGTCVRAGAKHNLALQPILVHATDYYYRIYLRCLRGRGVTDNAMKELGFICQRIGDNSYQIIRRNDLFNEIKSIQRQVLSQDGHRIKFAGPLWLGKLYDSDFLKGLNTEKHILGTSNKITKNIVLWREEAESLPGFYDANSLSSQLKISTPPLNRILNNLEELGFIATKTHFNSNAFKTDAPFSEVCDLIKKL